MAASVLYTNFGGMLVHEDRGGVERSYVHDEMGNTSFLVDATSITDRYDYSPYGQVSHVGSSVTPFTFIGALGYFATGWSMLTSYVRARWYSNVSGQWSSVDPLWPWQKSYQYVDGNPARWTDPSGLGLEFTQDEINCCLKAALIAAVGAALILAGKALFTCFVCLGIAAIACATSPACFLVLMLCKEACGHALLAALAAALGAFLTAFTVCLLSGTCKQPEPGFTGGINCLEKCAGVGEGMHHDAKAHRECMCRCHEDRSMMER